MARAPIEFNFVLLEWGRSLAIDFFALPTTVKVVSRLSVETNNKQNYFSSTRSPSRCLPWQRGQSFAKENETSNKTTGDRYDCPQQSFFSLSPTTRERRTVDNNRAMKCRPSRRRSASKWAFDSRRDVTKSWAIKKQRCRIQSSVKTGV